MIFFSQVKLYCIVFWIKFAEIRVNCTVVTLHNCTMKFKKIPAIRNKRLKNIFTHLHRSSGYGLASLCSAGYGNGTRPLSPVGIACRELCNGDPVSLPLLLCLPLLPPSMSLYSSHFLLES